MSAKFGEPYLSLISIINQYKANMIELFLISEPSIRGMLIAMAGIAATLGLFLVFLLGSLTAWRNVALICFTVPVATLVAICLVRTLINYMYEHHV